MHETHHGQTGVDGLNGRVDLIQIVVQDSGGFQFFSFTRHCVTWNNKFHGGQVILSDDLVSGILVDQEGGTNTGTVHDSDVQDDGWIFHIDFSGNLHHDKHEQQVADLWIHGRWERC